MCADRVMVDVCRVCYMSGACYICGMLVRGVYDGVRGVYDGVRVCDMCEVCDESNVYSACVYVVCVMCAMCVVPMVSNI